jgi:hypothetical protein
MMRLYIDFSSDDLTLVLPKVLCRTAANGFPLASAQHIVTKEG